MTTIGLSYSLVKISTKCAPALDLKGGMVMIVVNMAILIRFRVAPLWEYGKNKRVYKQWLYSIIETANVRLHFANRTYDPVSSL